MATKKTKTTKTGTGAVAPAPAEPLAFERVARELEDFLYAEVIDSDAINDQVQKIETLEVQLKVERDKLEHLGVPLRKLHAFIQSPAYRKFSQTEPYDEPLKTCCGQLQLATVQWNGKKKPTGAKPWKELQEQGASDAQITKNLQCRKPSYGGAYSLDINGPAWEFTFRPKKHVVSVKILSGAAVILQEIRRVLAIPTPAAKPAAKKPAAKKPAAKKPAASKSKPPASRGGPAAPPAPAPPAPAPPPPAAGRGLAGVTDNPPFTSSREDAQ